MDVNRELAEGQALDLMHGSSLVADQRITGGGTELAVDADMVVITAGLRRKPDESRLALINRNVELFRGILADLKKHGLKKEAMVFVVSNPVDVLTYLAVKELSLSPAPRLRLGNHARHDAIAGDSGRPVERAADAGLRENVGRARRQHGGGLVGRPGGGTAARQVARRDTRVVGDVEKRTRGSGAEVIKKKTGAGFAVGVAIAEVVHSVALDRRRILPVSTLLTGAYQLRDVCLSVPTVVGRQGILGHIELELWPKERMGLANSAKVLRETIEKVLK